jgi:hypothetical protein
VFSFWEKVEQDSGIEQLLSQLSFLQELFSRGVESPMQGSEKFNSLIRENGFKVLRHRTSDFDSGDR